MWLAKRPDATRFFVDPSFSLSGSKGVSNESFPLSLKLVFTLSEISSGDLLEPPNETELVQSGKWLEHFVDPGSSLLGSKGHQGIILERR